MKLIGEGNQSLRQQISQTGTEPGSEKTGTMGTKLCFKISVFEKQTGETKWESWQLQNCAHGSETKGLRRT